jgi:hypothetical protein
MLDNCLGSPGMGGLYLACKLCDGVGLRGGTVVALSQPRRVAALERERKRRALRRGAARHSSAGKHGERKWGRSRVAGRQWVGACESLSYRGRLLLVPPCAAVGALSGAGGSPGQPFRAPAPSIPSQSRRWCLWAWPFQQPWCGAASAP